MVMGSLELEWLRSGLAATAAFATMGSASSALERLTGTLPFCKNAGAPAMIGVCRFVIRTILFEPETRLADVVFGFS